MSTISDQLRDVQDHADGYLRQATTLRGFLIIVCVFGAAWALMRLINKSTIEIARATADRADKAANEDRFVQWRQIETYLSVVLAIVRAVIVGGALYIAIRMLFPGQTLLPATIGISTFFVIVAGATVAPLLRDLTNGVIMIVGRWLSVGDFVKIEPFNDMAGVVERVTLRSTTLRSINGDITHLHNQYIQGVRISPRGARTLAIELFVRDLKKGLAHVEEVIQTLPASPTMIVTPLRVSAKEKITDNLWRITITGKTAPSREWLIEDFIRSALQDQDTNKKEPLIVYGPLVHYADPEADKRFSRAVRRGTSVS